MPPIPDRSLKNEQLNSRDLSSDSFNNLPPAYSPGTPKINLKKEEPEEVSFLQNTFIIITYNNVGSCTIWSSILF